MSGDAETGARGCDLVWNRLVVSGPVDRLGAFKAAAAGPGFYNWRTSWFAVQEDMAVRMMLPGAGAPSIDAAHEAARRMANQMRGWQEQRASIADTIDSAVQPLDLGALIPIPERVLSAGFFPDGEEWLWANWGVRRPIRKVLLKSEVADGAAVGVLRYEFLSEDWSPWVAVATLRGRWSDLRFELTWDHVGLVDPETRGAGAPIAADEVVRLARVMARAHKNLAPPAPGAAAVKRRKRQLVPGRLREAERPARAARKKVAADRSGGVE